MSGQRWDNVSYLDALRPDPGWHTEYALLASYSADLVALVAALLALAGLDDDRGSGSKVDFANTLEQLKDRVRLVVQSGRLVAPPKAPKILAILDRYVREVSLDEQTASWHPKIALVRLASDEGDGAQWRLWIGSRNLTRDIAWDVGLTLVGTPNGHGKSTVGIADLGAALAHRAQLRAVSPARVGKELRSVSWSTPPGCDVQEVHLFDEQADRGLPTAPDGLRELIVVSPFLDGATVAQLGTWGPPNARRLLVSTRSELCRLAQQSGRPLAGFDELLLLDAPQPDEANAREASNTENAQSEDEEPESRGLHAKVILADHKGGRTLWVGSANATRRGWGKNAEVVARALVNADVARGLLEFVQTARTASLEELSSPEPLDEAEERLEAARRQTAARWAVVLRVNEEIPVLNTASPPHPDDPEITLQVGLIGGELVHWPRGQPSLRLPPASAGELTELVHCRLRMQDSELDWVQRTPLEPPPDDERDRRALARYLDARTFLAWIRSLLTGDALSDGGGDWDADRSKSNRKTHKPGGPAWWAPTIEEVLKAWGRDPASLTSVDRKVQYYLRLFRERDDIEISDEERRVVEEFQRAWNVIRRELVIER